MKQRAFAGREMNREVREAREAREVLNSSLASRSSL
jgi:hypothetical protein